MARPSASVLGSGRPDALPFRNAPYARVASPQAPCGPAGTRTLCLCPRRWSLLWTRAASSGMHEWAIWPRSLNHATIRCQTGSQFGRGNRKNERRCCVRGQTRRAAEHAPSPHQRKADASLRSRRVAGGRALFKKLLKILNGSCPVQARKKEK